MSVAGLEQPPSLRSNAGRSRLCGCWCSMNPLGLQPERFTVAEREGEVLGFVQLQPQLGGNSLGYLELRTLIVAKDHR